MSSFPFLIFWCPRFTWFTRMCVCVSICLSVCLCMCLPVWYVIHVFVCLCVFMFVCLCLCMCVCVCLCVWKVRPLGISMNNFPCLVYQIQIWYSLYNVKSESYPFATDNRDKEKSVEMHALRLEILTLIELISLQRSEILTPNIIKTSLCIASDMGHKGKKSHIFTVHIRLGEYKTTMSYIKAQR